ncbi:MAG: acyl-CoA thioesterase [Desulfobacterales bacterium]|jgi:acyl-CoA hydrolase
MKNAQADAILSHFLLPEDANPVGNIHGGVIMKHIDSAAGVAAFRHARCNVVTASIDRLDFVHPAYVGNLLILKASVNLTGRTSIEIGVRAEAEDLLTGAIRHIASAYLTFVALDENGSPRPVTPFKPGTREQKRRHRAALRRREARLAERRREAACERNEDDCD